MDSEFCYDVFCAYHGTNRGDGTYQVAQRVWADLKKHNVKPFCFNNNEEWLNVIKKVTKSTCMLVFVNENAPRGRDGFIEESSQLNREINCFLQNRNADVLRFVYCGEKTDDIIGISEFVNSFHPDAYRCDKIMILKNNNYDEICEWVIGKIGFNEFDDKELISTITGRLIDYKEILSAKTIHLDPSKNEADIFAFNRITSTNNNMVDDIPAKIYHLHDSFIRGVKYLKENDVEKIGIGKGYNDYAKECCINIEGDIDYCYWPIDLDPDPNKPVMDDKISICSICFGAMLLRNWLVSDISLSGSDMEVFDENIRRELLGALKLLMTLRDYEKFGWMSNVSFIAEDEPCTINQTILALSTLLNCGFLSYKNEDRNSDILDMDYYSSEFSEIFLKRISYIEQSFNWIYAQKMEQENGRRIFFPMRTTGNEEATPCSMTVYVFETTQKYVSTLINALINDVDKKFEQNCVEEITKKIKLYINRMVGMLRHFRYIYKRYYNVMSKYITNNAKVLKAMCSIRVAWEADEYSNYIENVQSDEIIDIIDELISKTYKSVINNKELSFNDTEIYENYYFIDANRRDTSNQKFEKYENCCELIRLDALIKYAELSRDKSVIIKVKEDYCKFVDDFVMTYNTIQYVKGHNKNLLFPIFSLYYYRMVLFDLLRLIKKYQPEENCNEI